LTIYLNTNGLFNETHHDAKSTLGKLGNGHAIVVSDAEFLDLISIPDEQLGANMVQ
jgi:hypothetical protein